MYIISIWFLLLCVFDRVVVSVFLLSLLSSCASRVSRGVVVGGGFLYIFAINHSFYNTVYIYIAFNSGQANSGHSNKAGPPRRRQGLGLLLYY